LCSSARLLDLSKVAYLNAKNAPTINPGTEINHTDVDTASDNRIPKTPEAIDAIISISVTCFVAANVKDWK
jgi:hypothetical protein